VVNPKIGSDLKYGREVEEEKPAEVVENHRGGARMGIGVLISKAGSDDSDTHHAERQGVRKGSSGQAKVTEPGRHPK